NEVDIVGALNADLTQFL
nr:RecName: Full=Unknown protein 6 [Pseudotsuga menziesii]